MRLILIRHGQTDYTLQNRYCGFHNPPLNKEGLRQAQRLAARLGSTSLDKIYSSDLIRASQTARIIFQNSPIEYVADLREMNFGVFEGLSSPQIMNRYPQLYRNWINNPRKLKIPRGEALAAFSKRVQKRISAIICQYPEKTVAVITHSGPIRIILCSALTLELKMFWQIKPEPCALTIIEYGKDSSARLVKLD